MIKKHNKLKSNFLKLKQKLVIPGVLAKRKARNYYVKKGDTLLSIAKKNATNVKTLMADNNLKNSLIRQGDRIVIK